jgi:hypothetical protein
LYQCLTEPGGNGPDAWNGKGGKPGDPLEKKILVVGAALLAEEL